MKAWARRLLLGLGVLGYVSIASTVAGEAFAKPPVRPPVPRPKPKVPASQSTGLAVTVQVIASPPVNYTNWLGPNAPNPFNGSTIIRYNCQQPGNVSVRVYTIQGRLVATLVNRFHNTGTYSLWWDGTSEHGKVASGVYIYRMVAGSLVQSRRFILLR